MNNRQRKKWQKKYGTYINPKEIWNLDYTIAEFVLPRLKMFKNKSIGDPGCDGIDTREKWNATLDKMILAFEYLLDDNWWIGDPEYDFSDGLHVGYEKDNKTGGFHKVVISEDDWVKEVSQKRDEEEQRRKQVIDEGLQLFAEWFRYLWW